MKSPFEFCVEACALLFVAATYTLPGFAASAPKIVFDTDMVEDYDDVGALAVLHALQDECKCEIIAMATCTRDNASVAAVEIINAFYGRPDIPVGCSKGMGVIGVPGGSPERKGHRKFARLAAAYPESVKHPNSNDAPDANVVYRKALAAAPDKSVVFVSVGFATNMRRLLETVGDGFSPLDGRELVAKKVTHWYAMACKYPKGREYNSKWDAESSKIAFEQWPTPIVFSDFDLGRNIYSGRIVAETEYAYRNPVKDIFCWSLPSRELVRSGKCWDKSEEGHSSWDEVTVFAAIHSADRYFSVEHGTFRMVGDGGRDEWVPDANSPHCRLLVGENSSSQEIGSILNELIAREPDCKAAKVGIDIQREIDSAAANGGGRVVVPAGLHETRPLCLKSNVELHLEEGSELLFTDELDAYLPAVETCRGGVECLNYKPLVYANGATNISITGHGTLRPRMGLWECWQWGGDMAKSARETLFGVWGEQGAPLPERDLTKLPDSMSRPQFIGLKDCRNVKLEDFMIRHSPSWCVHLFKCEEVEIRRLDIQAYMHNNDGLDIESSRNVLVEDCRISVGDDIICLKSGRDADGRRRGVPTENVVVRRCVADCGHAFFGIGSELSGGIRNAVMEDCVMEGTCAWLFRIKTTPARGGFVEDVAMRRVRAKNVTASALNIVYGYGNKSQTCANAVLPTRIAGVVLDDVQVGEAERACEIEGDVRLPVKGVSLKGFRVGKSRRPDVVENAELAVE